MRYPIAASTNARVKPTEIFHSKRVHHGKLQIFDQASVFVAVREQDLESPDALGNSTKGFQYSGPGIFEFFFISGQLLATSNQDTSVEFQAWPLPWVMP